MELTNTNRSRAYPDRLGMDVEKIQKRISVFSFEGMRKGRQVKNLSFLLFQFTHGTKQAALCLHENLPAGSQEGSAAS